MGDHYRKHRGLRRGQALPDSSFKAIVSASCKLQQRKRKEGKPLIIHGENASQMTEV